MCVSQEWCFSYPMCSFIYVYASLVRTSFENFPFIQYLVSQPFCISKKINRTWQICSSRSRERTNILSRQKSRNFCLMGDRMTFIPSWIFLSTCKIQISYEWTPIGHENTKMWCNPPLLYRMLIFAKVCSWYHAMNILALLPINYSIACAGDWK